MGPFFTLKLMNKSYLRRKGELKFQHIEDTQNIADTAPAHADKYIAAGCQAEKSSASVIKLMLMRIFRLIG